MARHQENQDNSSQSGFLFEESTNLQRRRLLATLFRRTCRAISYLLVGMVCYLLWDVFSDGIPWLSWDFLTHYASRLPEKSGIKASLFGSLWVIAITITFALPVGIGAGTYLEELMPEGKLKDLISLNIQNLAGVPSIVYGILGLAIFVRTFNFGTSVLSGGLTLGLLILPIIIIVTRESLRSVPQSIRQAALAMGATEWQVVKYYVLPTSFSGILTGVILAVSRAIGETAPLILVGAVAYIRYTPDSPLDAYTTLPIQIYNWVGKPKQEFHELAAAGILVLLAIMFLINLVAIVLRQRKQKTYI
ncbi:MAG: phosphate ABC transporter permease PstA [Proteobacteria bacterium]|nr:phosphate ABC transporter permease PstA [Pseudomonadota bacterium]